MNINANRLASTLKDSQYPIVVLSGEDQDQVEACAQHTVKHYIDKGYVLDMKFTVERSGHAQEIIENICNGSLLMDKQLFVIQIHGTPGNWLGQFIDDYEDKMSEDKAIIIKTDKIKKSDQQRKWYQKMSQHALMVSVWPLSTQEQIAWMQGWCKNHQLDCAPSILSMIAEKNHGNHSACKQTLERLKLAFPDEHITEDDARPHLFNQAEYALHELLSDALCGQLRPLLSILDSMNLNEQPIQLLLWHLHHELTLCHQLMTSSSSESIYKAHRIWPSKKAIYEKAIRQMKQTHIVNWLNFLNWLDQSIKAGQLREWADEIKNLLICICQREPIALYND